MWQIIRAVSQGAGGLSGEAPGAGGRVTGAAEASEFPGSLFGLLALS